MGSLAHNLTMHNRSWHSRWYHLWLSLGGKKPAYKENLCRYVRILLIWAPLRWFFKGRIKRVPPWVAGLPLLAAVVTATAANMWPGWVLTILKWTGIGSGALFGLILAIIIFALLAAFCEEHPDKVKKAGKIVTSPLWIVPYGIYRITKPVWVRAVRPTEIAIGWFFGEIYPAVLVIVVGIVLGFVYQTSAFVKGAEILGAVVGLCVVLVIGLVVSQEWGSELKRPFRRLYTEVVDTLKLAVTYVGTKKRGSRICPFIEFEDNSMTP